LVAFFGLAAGFFLGLTASPILNDPEAAVPFDCFELLFLTPALSESLRRNQRPRNRLQQRNQALNLQRKLPSHQKKTKAVKPKKTPKK
jgi:hypothetical protein